MVELSRANIVEPIHISQILHISTAHSLKSSTKAKIKMTKGIASGGVLLRHFSITTLLQPLSHIISAMAQEPKTTLSENVNDTEGGNY